MESKRKIVNGETVISCDLSVTEWDIICGALYRRYCQLDEKRVNAGDSPAAELYEEMAEKVDVLIEKIQDIRF